MPEIIPEERDSSQGFRKRQKLNTSEDPSELRYLDCLRSKGQNQKRSTQRPSSEKRKFLEPSKELFLLLDPPQSLISLHFIFILGSILIPPRRPRDDFPWGKCLFAHLQGTKSHSETLGTYAIGVFGVE
jgi:hypothetical protein